MSMAGASYTSACLTHVSSDPQEIQAGGGVWASGVHDRLACGQSRHSVDTAVGFGMPTTGIGVEFAIGHAIHNSSLSDDGSKRGDFGLRLSNGLHACFLCGGVARRGHAGRDSHRSPSPP